MRSLLLGSALVLCPAVVVAADSWQPPVPQAMVDDQAFAVATITDATATLAHIDGIVRRFDETAVPGQVGEQLTSLLGLTDASVIAPGPVLIAVGPGGAAPAVALILPCLHAGAQLAGVTEAGFVAEAEGNLLIIALAGPAIDLGRRVAAQHAAIAADPPPVAVRIGIAPPRILDAYRFVLPTLPTLAKAQIQRDPQTAPLAPLCGLTISSMLAAAEDLAAIQLDLFHEDFSIRSEMVVAARADSGLAAALVAPTERDLAPVAHRLGFEPGFLVMLGSSPMDAQMRWIKALLISQRDTPDGKTVIDDDLIAMCDAWIGIATGPMGIRIRSGADGVMISDGVLAITDSERHRTAQRAMMTGPLAQFFAALGIAVTFDEAVRESNGLPVDRISYAAAEPANAEVPADADADAEAAQAEDVDAPETITATAMMLHELPIQEHAYPPGFSVWSDDPAGLDALVQGSDARLPTSAARVFGDGRDGYVDWCLIRQMQGQMRDQMKLMAEMDFPLGDMFAPMLALPPGEPMTATWSTVDGRLGMEWRIPLQPMLDLQRAFAAGMDQMHMDAEPIPDDAEEPAPAGAPGMPF